MIFAHQGSQRSKLSSRAKRKCSAIFDTGVFEFLWSWVLGWLFRTQEKPNLRVRHRAPHPNIRTFVPAKKALIFGIVDEKWEERLKPSFKILPIFSCFSRQQVLERVQQSGRLLPTLQSFTPRAAPHFNSQVCLETLNLVMSSQSATRHVTCTLGAVWCCDLSR